MDRFLSIIYLGVDGLAHGNSGTLQCILLHTEVTPLEEGENIYGEHVIISSEKNIRGENEFTLLFMRIAACFKEIGW